MCFCCCVPLQGTVLLTPGAHRASSAQPAAMAWVKSCPPSLRHLLEGTWEWEAASQTLGLLSLHQAKGWCPHWWVQNTPLHTSLRTFECLCCRAERSRDLFWVFIERLSQQNVLQEFAGASLRCYHINVAYCAGDFGTSIRAIWSCKNICIWATCILCCVSF